MREKPDQILGGRYRILEKVGEGGMAQVYRGMDVKLNRPVAIKILYEHLSSDRDFLRRFKLEAKAAAKLMHPAIVNVFDEGEEKGLHYIVMEYIDGLTLKDIILREERLSPVEAVRIALQICEALIHAHEQNIIHRDIKPQNIIVAPGGRVKVTDFGLARAATDATITYGKSLFGSVYYSSPEQARGSSADLKTDIYSLGIVLYEMLTGEVPFFGESPVSIALKHLQEEIIPPGNIVQGLSPALELIVIRATRKERNMRYSSAAKFRDDLRDWLKTEKGGEHFADDFLQRLKSYSPFSPISQDKDSAPVYQEKPVIQEEKPAVASGKKQKVRSPKKIILYVSLALVFLLLLFTGYQLLRGFLFVPEVIVPDLTGLSLEEAEKELAPLGLHYTVVGNEHSDTIPPAHIVSQDPLPQRKVRKNREIAVTLSAGQEYINVPDLVEHTEREARLKLQDIGLEMDLSYEYSDTVASGYIIRQDPGKGFQVARGDTVHVIISEGKKPFAMNDLRGRQFADAREWLERNGLVLRDQKEEFSADFAPGEIISQYPAAGESVYAGESVDLVISKGEEPDAAPTYHLKVDPRVPVGRVIKICVEDEEGARVVFEGEYQGREISVTGIGEGRVILMELEDEEYQIIDTKPFP